MRRRVPEVRHVVVEQDGPDIVPDDPVATIPDGPEFVPDDPGDVAVAMGEAHGYHPSWHEDAARIKKHFEIRAAERLIRRKEKLEARPCLLRCRAKNCRRGGVACIHYCHQDLDGALRRWGSEKGFYHACNRAGYWNPDNPCASCSTGETFHTGSPFCFRWVSIRAGDGDEIPEEAMGSKPIPSFGLLRGERGPIVIDQDGNKFRVPVYGMVWIA